MTKPLYVYVFAICLVAACTPAAQQPPSQSVQQTIKAAGTNPDAGLIADFKTRVDDYVKLRSKAEGKAPTELEAKSKPAEIVVAEKSLGQKVREARPEAKRGEFFTPATEAMFRRLLKAPLKGPEGAENKAIIKDDAPPAKDVLFKVNAEYPKDVPLSTVPPDVLLSLPALPEDVQYRFAGKHLLLYDAKANLIIDYMLNAIP